MLGRGGHRQVLSDEEFLISPIFERGKLAADDDSRLAYDPHLVIGGTLKERAATGFAHYEAICDPRDLGNIKSMLAQRGDDIVKGSGFGFLPGHGVEFGGVNFISARLIVHDHCAREQTRHIRSMATATAKQYGTRSLERIGNTPLLRLEHITAHLPGVQVLGKAEWANPGGSVKDRAAAAIVADAQRRGLLKPGVSLLDATSGNTGIAYAMLGAAMRFPVTLCVPANVSPERKRILAAYGATIVWTDPADGSDGAIRKARELAAAEPDRYYYANQYGNNANWEAHYHTTANEIWEQTEGALTHFVAGLGTSGTFVGATRRFRELNPRIKCISMQPDSTFHGLEGLKHMKTAIVPAIYDPSLADQNVEMSTETAYAMAKRLAREEGLLVGVSAAAAVAASLRIAEETSVKKEMIIVTILPDAADKYLSERFWEE
jgi:cysteine synthase B